MNETVTASQQHVPTIFSRHSVCLFAIIGINYLLLLTAIIGTLQWLPRVLPYTHQWSVIGILFPQVSLLAFWGAFRGGSLATRLAMPALLVVLAGFLASNVFPQMFGSWEPQFSVQPVPLLLAYLVGLGLLLPFRWWSGKSLLFRGEEPPPGRPRQVRIDQVASWMLLMGVTFGLARAGSAVDLVQADLALLLLGPAVLGWMAILSIPLVRGVFVNSHPVIWTTCGLLLVLGIGFSVGGADYAQLWQTYARRWSWFDYSGRLTGVVVFHGIAGLIFVANLTAIRLLGGRFAVAVESTPTHVTTIAPSADVIP